MGGSKFPKSRINSDNFQVLYRNTQLMNDIVQLISYVYAACDHYKDSLMKNAIEELLNYLIDTKDEKHLTFLKSIAENDNFKLALDPNSELSSKINEIYLFGQNMRKKLKETDIEYKRELNQMGKDKCKKSEESLHKLMKEGGAFTRKDALLLEFCNNAIESFLKD